MSDHQIQKQLVENYSNILKEWSFPDKIKQDEVFHHYLIYLAIKMVFHQSKNQEIVTPPPKIDMLWHSHLAYTKNYAQFNIWCAGRFPGFSYLHHHPDEVSLNKEEILEYIPSNMSHQLNGVWDFHKKPLVISHSGCG